MSDDTINIILTAVIVPVLLALTGYIIDLLKKKSKDLQAATKSKELQGYISMAENAITNSVSAISQTYVQLLKDEGTFDAEAQKIAFTKAKFRVLGILSDSAKDALTEAFKDLDTYLDIGIESAVWGNKTAITTVTTTPDVTTTTTSNTVKEAL